MSGGEKAFRVLASRKTTLVLLVVLAALFTFGMVVPQHVSGEAIGHAYSSSVTQVVTGMGIHALESSWLVQLAALLLGLNLLAVVLSRTLGGIPAAVSGPARSPVTRSVIAMADPPNQLEAWLSQRLPRVGAHLTSRDRAVGRLGFRLEATVLVAVGGLVLIVAAGIGARTPLAKIVLVEGADDAAAARFVATQVKNDAELPWKPPFEIQCGRSQDGTLRGARRCAITWDGTPHEATVKPGTDLEFLGLRLTLVGLERLPLSGSLDLDVTYDGNQRSRTTSALGTPLDITLPDGRVTAILGGSTDGAPVGLLLGQVPADKVTGRLAVTARPRAALTFRVSNTQHVVFVWGGAALALIGLFGLTVLPAYRIEVVRESSALAVEITGFGALANPQRLADTLNAGVAS